MTGILLTVASVLVATNRPSALSNAVVRTTGIRVSAPASKSADPVERDYEALLEKDNEAQVEVDECIRKENAFAEKGANLPSATLNGRIEQRFAPVKKAYEQFILRHPDHARARLAFGSFLNDIGEDLEAVSHWEKALKLDPTKPAAWNNLANYYGHNGPALKAFDYYQKAIELKPDESVYYHNFGTAVYMFRQEAKVFFKCGEQEVFDRALELYQKALHFNPNDFPLASDLAQTYYGIKPLRVDDAVKAWEYTLKIARDSIEREGIQIHLARIKLNAGRLTEARQHLDSVTNTMYAPLRNRIHRNIDEKEEKTKKQIGPVL